MGISFIADTLSACPLLSTRTSGRTVGGYIISPCPPLSTYSFYKAERKIKAVAY